MAHVTRDRDKILNRIRRIRGQLNAVEKAVTDGTSCATVLHTLAACRGALNGLMAELLEEHVRHHVVDPDDKPESRRSRGAGELIEILRKYLR